MDRYGTANHVMLRCWDFVVPCACGHWHCWSVFHPAPSMLKSRPGRQVSLVDEYTALMETKVVAMVGDALAKLAPSTLRMAEGRTGFAVNRRNNREADVPAILAKGEPLKGPVDHAVPVLTVTGADQKLIAIVFGYACHPTTLNFTKWCGDFPGFAQIALEKNHPGALAMFVNTCGGDQNP